MAVFVDNYRVPAKVQGWRGRWSHLSADTVEELHQFAESIGLDRRMFQTCKRQCHKTLPCVHWHYDVLDSKRTEAIKKGAKPIDIREWTAITDRRRREAEKAGL